MNTQNRTHIKTDLARAICFELPTDAPEWIELLPPGQQIVGRDGRSWINPDPAAVIAATQAHGLDLPVDYEHATEVRAPNGEPAPAAAWIDHKSLRISESGAIEGRVEWTERGRNSVASREYRYISPVFIYTKGDYRVVRLDSVGLTNKPNLHLKALNQQHHEDEPMLIAAAILQALGLPDSATEADVVSAINQQRQDLAAAKNSQQPSLDKYVPREDYNSVLARATNAEQRLREKIEAERDAEIQRELDAALEAGKITPATLEYHKAQCRTEGGLERFKAYVAAAPSVTDPLGLDKKPTDRTNALTEEEKAACRLLGQSEDEYLKAKGAN